jgi:hypothetical protein
MAFGSVAILSWRIECFLKLVSKISTSLGLTNKDDKALVFVARGRFFVYRGS